MDKKGSQILYQDIIEFLKKEEFLNDYIYNKSKKSFVNDRGQEKDIIRFRYWNGFDLKHDKESLVIQPLYLKRFEEVHQFSDEFSYKKISDLKSSYTIGKQGSQLRIADEFYFTNEDLITKEQYRNFKDLITKVSQQFFLEYSSLRKLYDKEIFPLLKNKSLLLNFGGDWIFRYLYIVKEVDSHNYETFKLLFYEHIKHLHSTGEPNALHFYPKWNSIINKLEN